MAKKSFGMGIDALFEEKNKSSSTKKASEPTNKVNEDVDSQIEQIKEKKAPKKRPENFVKVGIQMKEDLHNKFKAIAHWERLQQRDLLEQMLNQYFSGKGEEFVDTALNSYQQHNS